MIVGVASWRGTGATTLATLLSVTFAARSEPAAPTDVWLIEADPAGGVLGARLELVGAAHGGLERVAFPDARNATVGATERVADAALAFGGVRVVPAPGEPFRAWACHLPRLPWAPLLRDLPGQVVVDLGRLRGGAPNAALLAQLDVLVLTAASDAVSVAATMEWAVARGRVSPSDPGLALDITRIAVVDLPDVQHAVSRVEAETELGDRFAGWVPWSPAAVDLVERGAQPGDRRLRRQPLLAAVAAVADRVTGWWNRDVAA